MVDLDSATGAQVGLLVLVRLATEPRHADEVQFLTDSLLADDVDLLAGLLKLRLLEVRGGREGGGEDLLRLDAQAELRELGLVPGAALGGVVGHEEQGLACRAQLLQNIRDALDARVAAPDNAIAIEDEDVHGVDEVTGCGQLLGLLRNGRRPESGPAAPRLLRRAPGQARGTEGRHGGADSPSAERRAGGLHGGGRRRLRTEVPRLLGLAAEGADGLRCAKRAGTDKCQSSHFAQRWRRRAVDVRSKRNLP
mmetsp:Transcript_77917/g.218629  ORF Transcript_77917/g.218629 Transcript_77917/m.218629 type:complete len:252 (+) Transcript_77917:743-1498(+)